MAKKQNGDLLYFEFVPLPISRSMHGIVSSIGYQLSFLVIGDALLRKLPVMIREKLKAPISADALALFACNNPNGIVPEQARAAMLVAETLFVIWEKIKPHLSQQSPNKRRKYRIAIDRDNGRLWYKKEIISYAAATVADIAKEMARNARIKYAIVLVMWKALLGVIREGNVQIPGLRRKR